MTAERIETGHRRAKPRTLACDPGQDSFFTHPLPAEAVAALLPAPPWTPRPNGTGDGRGAWAAPAIVPDPALTT